MLYIVKKTLKILHEKKAIGILQVKNNQKKLKELCEIVDRNGKVKNKTIITEKGHGRLDIREVKTYSLPIMADEDWKKYAKSLIVVNRTRKIWKSKTEQWVKSKERSFYISMKEFTAKESLDYIRGHWGIENSNHYVKDVIMKEDSSRIRVKPYIMAILRSLALNILRYFSTQNIKGQLYINSLSSNALIQSLLTLDFL